MTSCRSGKQLYLERSWRKLRLILRRGGPILHIFGEIAHANVLKDIFLMDWKSNCIYEGFAQESISSVTLVHLICSTIWSRRRVVINDFSFMYVCTRMIHILRFVIEQEKLWTYYPLCRAPRHTTQNTWYTTYLFSHGSSAPDQPRTFSWDSLTGEANDHKIAPRPASS